jgi:hypothetical protein
MKKRLLILILISIAAIAKGQYSILDWIDIKTSQNEGISQISLYINENDKKILVEKMDLNSKGLVIKNIKYCNFLYKPLDSIEQELFEYDQSDTLLTSRMYKNENGDTLIFFKYTYEFDSTGKMLSKGTENITFNNFECEKYTYNDSGLIIQERTNFYNESKDIIRNFITIAYRYDKYDNLIDESFISDSIVEFERIYKYDSLNNLISYKTQGAHQCGDDIDRDIITYNSKSLPIQKEFWNASGENWGFDYTYDDNGNLIKKITKMKYAKNQAGERNDSLPPPPYYTQDMLEDNYTDVYEYNFIYNSKNKLITVIETSLDDNFKREFSIEYE